MKSKCNCRKGMREKDLQSTTRNPGNVELPIQRAGQSTSTGKDVKEAVKELNPDQNSMGSRG